MSVFKSVNCLSIPSVEKNCRQVLGLDNSSLTLSEAAYMAESRIFSIKDKKLRLDKPEDCTDVAGLLTSSKTFERVELNGNTISAPAAKVLAEALATQEQLKVPSLSLPCFVPVQILLTHSPYIQPGG